MISVDRIHNIVAELHSFGEVIEEAFHALAKRVKDVVTSPVGQGLFGAGLGLGMHKVYSPLTIKVVKALGFSFTDSDPFAGLGFGCKIFFAPFVCVLGPIMEEKTFRGDLQEALEKKFDCFYTKLGFSDSAANISARMSSVFFGSVIFGVIHFSNALVFYCNPVLFLPQVVAATFMGLILGLAKEFSGELFMPIGIHIANNTLAWAQYLYESF